MTWIPYCYSHVFLFNGSIVLHTKADILIIQKVRFLRHRFCNTLQRHHNDLEFGASYTSDIIFTWFILLPLPPID